MVRQGCASIDEPRNRAGRALSSTGTHSVRCCALLCRLCPQLQAQVVSQTAPGARADHATVRQATRVSRGVCRVVDGGHSDSSQRRALAGLWQGLLAAREASLCGLLFAQGGQGLQRQQSVDSVRRRRSDSLLLSRCASSQLLCRVGPSYTRGSCGGLGRRVLLPRSPGAAPAIVRERCSCHAPSAFNSNRSSRAGAT